MLGSTRGRVSHPLLAVIALILLPGLALGYFGFRALAEKENSLRTNYTATTVLVRDRLAAELTRLESDVGNALTRSSVPLDNPTTTANWLATLSAQRPWFDRPFLLRVDGAVMIGSIRADWSRPVADPLGALPRLAAAIHNAEGAEFVQGNLELALRQYRQALALVPSSSAAHALVLTRVGRTLVKLRRFDEAVAQYRAVLALPSNMVDRNGLPYVVIALLQLADSFEALGQPDERMRSERQLLQYIVDHPGILKTAMATTWPARWPRRSHRMRRCRRKSARSREPSLPSSGSAGTSARELSRT